MYSHSDKVYQASIGNGHSVFIVTGDASRMRNEVKNLPDGWHINIWDITEEEKAIHCNGADFIKA